MRTATYLAALAALLNAGCAGPKVVLLERADYQFTRPGDAIVRDGAALAETTEAGIWFRRGAMEKLQERGFIPWDK